MSAASLDGRRCWIFDMDGTLTVPIHDFEAIRAALGLPLGLPILESLLELPAAAAEEKRRRLSVIELELARAAEAAPGAEALLAALRRRGDRLGILTRNSRANARLTLETCGLAGYFPEADRVTRDDGPPKPAPAGIHLLLGRWDGRPDQAVMLGDFRFDLEAGRAAGCATVHVEAGGRFRWPELADRCVRRLDELLPL